MKQINFKVAVLEAQKAFSQPQSNNKQNTASLSGFKFFFLTVLVLLNTKENLGI